MMVTTKAFLRGGPRDRGLSRQISMGTAIPDVPRRRPGGVSEVTGHRDPWEKRLPRAPSKGASDPGEESVTVPRDPQGCPPLTPLPSRQQHNQTRLNSRDSADAGAARGGDSGPPRPARTSAAARCNSSSVGEAVTRGPHGTPTLLTGTSGLPSPWRRKARPHGYGHVHSGHEGRPCPSRPPGSNTERTRGVAAWGGGRCPPNLAAGPRRVATPRAGRVGGRGTRRIARALGKGAVLTALAGGEDGEATSAAEDVSVVRGRNVGVTGELRISAPPCARTEVRR